MIKDLFVSLWRIIFGKPQIGPESVPGLNEILFRKFDRITPESPKELKTQITIEARPATMTHPKGPSQDPRYHARLFKKFEL